MDQHKHILKRERTTGRKTKKKKKKERTIQLIDCNYGKTREQSYLIQSRVRRMWC